ncbi:ARL14 effector protein [Cylas formicarius]|uniref:ARL14 effector protein n=1 Tax=Cylas formicarius TaxID=197179 RepID=UPI0029586DE8|nr:ARL14 effector protein [Cylas formicarius]
MTLSFKNVISRITQNKLKLADFIRMGDSESSEEEYNPKTNARENRTARKSTTQTASAPTSNYATRRQAARNASKAIANTSSSFEQSMETFNPDLSQRERRKISRKFTTPQTTVRRPFGAVYDEQGTHLQSGLDMCDCLNQKCPGCWFECPKCESQKCGTECRSHRKYIVDSIEYHGYDKTVKNPIFSYTK